MEFADKMVKKYAQGHDNINSTAAGTERQLEAAFTSIT